MISGTVPVIMLKNDQWRSALPLATEGAQESLDPAIDRVKKQ